MDAQTLGVALQAISLAVLTAVWREIVSLRRETHANKNRWIGLSMLLKGKGIIDSRADIEDE